MAVYGSPRPIVGRRSMRDRDRTASCVQPKQGYGKARSRVTVTVTVTVTVHLIAQATAPGYCGLWFASTNRWETIDARPRSNSQPCAAQGQIYAAKATLSRDAVRSEKQLVHCHRNRETPKPPPKPALAIIAIPKTRRFRHSSPWSSLDDAWSRQSLTPLVTDTIILRDDS
jgi:hypothetical protein